MKAAARQDQVWEQDAGQWRLVAEAGPRPWRNLMTLWQGETDEQRARAEFCRRRCVLYRVNGRQRRSPWFRNLDHTHAALSFIEGKYGNGIIFVD